MRSIIVLADHHRSAENRLQAALAIARATSGHLTVQINTPMQNFVAVDTLGGAYIAGAALAEARLSDGELEARVDAQLTREDVPWTIVHSESDLTIALTDVAMLNDLAILPLDTAADGAQVADFVTGASCPVLALPDRANIRIIGGTAMVAFDGSPQASNALRAAVPLLRHAGAVNVVTIGDKEDGAAQAAMAYLSRHDIGATLVMREREGKRVEEALSKAADDLKADWIVMGAYGHGRLREAMFGGVTRYLVEERRWPLLLVH